MDRRLIKNLTTERAKKFKPDKLLNARWTGETSLQFIEQLMLHNNLHNYKRLNCGGCGVLSMACYSHKISNLSSSFPEPETWPAVASD